ncbi:MAG: hypothetical protein M0Q23_08845 [Syntrophales bacterium]|jgi:hypothetical protein|nr:hypothetical protein [Syntrophales bacterium]MCK9528727.1 hypothetical protein [Syntrophales bacterium]MDX9922982.1 hypothetical protein [Syntrophales bacterium]
MKLHVKFLFIPFLSLCFLLPSFAEAADKIKFQSDPLQRLDVRFRLFRTDNMWSYLLLDTSDGRLWHVTYTTDKEKGARLKIPINDKPFATKNSSKNGKFTLYSTDNMWNFILIDQDDGRAWQCQFTMEAKEEYRFCLPIHEISGLLGKRSALESEQSCEDACLDMFLRGQLKEGFTVQDCITTSCK